MDVLRSLLVRAALARRLCRRHWHPKSSVRGAAISRTSFRCLCRCATVTDVTLGCHGCSSLAAQNRRVRCFATSPETRVRGFASCASGRLSQRERFRPINAPVLRACGYKTASGRAKWLSRDPIEEKGGLNLYAYVRDRPMQEVDPLGLAGARQAFVREFFFPFGPQDIRNWWKGLKEADWGRPFELLPDTAWRLEEENMPGGHGDYGGAFSHSVFHCMLKRRGGKLLSCVAVAAHNWIFENPRGIFGDWSDDTSPGDRLANQAGANAANGPGTCVEECKKVYPPRARQ